MPLSDDQRAMLRLLAQREQGYEDIAALMGLSVDEVRAKVKDALDQLQAEGKDAPAVPAPAAPETPKAEPEPPRAEPEAPRAEPEPPPSQAPAVEPEPAVPATPTTAPISDPAGAPPPPTAAKKPRDKGLGIAVAAGVAGAIVIVVLAILLISGSDGDSDDSTSASNSATATTTTGEAAAKEAAANKEPTEAALEPVGGSTASGTATFGRVKNSLALGIEIKGLEPTDNKVDSYAIWLAQSPQRMLPLAATEAPKGEINASFEVPTEVLAYLANETFRQIVVTKTQNKLLEAALKKATAEEKAPAYTGVRVAEGTVTGPIVGAANDE